MSVTNWIYASLNTQYVRICNFFHLLNGLVFISTMWIVSTLKFLIELWTKQTYACMASVTEPIWFTLSSRQLQARSSAAFSILLGLVTVRSSPTTWIPTWAVRRDQASQSSWSNGSSMDTTGSEKGEVCYSSIGGVLVLTSDLIIITNNVIFQITQHKSLKLLDNFKISSFKWYKGNSFSCPELRF